MKEISVLIGGKAGEGINQAGLLIARLLAHSGFNIYIYYDYPSLIRGGHNFSIIRASQREIGSHLNKVDILLALNQDVIDFHKERLTSESVILYDSSQVKSKGIGLDLGTIIKEEKALPIMRNSAIIGGFCKAVGMEKEILEQVIKEHISKETDLNLKVALQGYNQTKEQLKIEPTACPVWPILTGNEAISLGLIKAGLTSYVAYPMTPASSVLHVLADLAQDFSLKVIHPENEIAVILMALGFAYAGERVAVGTSGGGFCLMTEGLSLSGMAEVPVTIVMSQRPGPSTGVPTYTCQSDLDFVLSAGQGEFLRLVAAPGDVHQAYYWSGVSLNTSWKWQIPSIILVDKALSEGSFSFDLDSIEPLEEEPIPLAENLQENSVPYKRYLDTPTGVSPLKFVPSKDEVIKVNSYTHDEAGITTEDAVKIKKAQDKILRKEKYLIEDLNQYEQVKTYGNQDAETALLCWGSNKGVCVEAAEKFSLKVIQPIVLCPFPAEQFKQALEGVKKIICVENNATAQLAGLVRNYGFNIDQKILKYDGRPFALDELEKELKKE